MKILARAVPGLLAATALLVVPSAAHAADKPVSLRTSYDCTTAAGTDHTTIRVRTTLPRSVKHGRTVEARRITAAIKLSETTVQNLRAVGVTSLKGSASKVRFKVGTQKVPLTRLRIPSTKVPDSGPMILRGSGRTTAFRVKRPGVYTVFVPTSINGTVVVGESSGGDVTSPLDCALVKGAPKAITTLKVTR